MEFIDFYSFISARIMLDLLSQDSAKAYVGRGENINNYLIASCVRNISAKNH